MCLTALIHFFRRKQKKVCHGYDFMGGNVLGFFVNLGDKIFRNFFNYQPNRNGQNEVCKRQMLFDDYVGTFVQRFNDKNQHRTFYGNSYRLRIRCSFTVFLANSYAALT